MQFKPPRFVQRLYPTVHWNFPEEREGIFLTFDDGPCPHTTLWILDKLDEFDAKATFFCLGKNVEQYPELAAEIVRRGHTLANHTYSHQKGWGMKTGTYTQDVDLADSFIHTKLFRPPYGRITPTQARVLSERYKIVMWDVLSLDYSASISKRQCARTVIKYARPGSVVVFHDSVKASRRMRYALPIVLEHFKQMNISIKRIEALYND